MSERVPGEAALDAGLFSTSPAMLLRGNSAVQPPWAFGVPPPLPPAPCVPDPAASALRPSQLWRVLLSGCLQGRPSSGGVWLQPLQQSCALGDDAGAFPAAGPWPSVLLRGGLAGQPLAGGGNPPESPECWGMMAEPSKPNGAQAGLQKPLDPIVFVLPCPGTHALMLGSIRESHPWLRSGGAASRGGHPTSGAAVSLAPCRRG